MCIGAREVDGSFLLALSGFKERLTVIWEDVSAVRFVLFFSSSLFYS